ncbi:MAG: hypothetical protein ACRCWY_04135 [Cellulosilyticaceae bacterium]
MSCGCSTKLTDGKAIVDFVRGKGKADTAMQVKHEVACTCGKPFIMQTVVQACPICGMTYGVTPCGSLAKENIKPAGIGY